MEIHNEVREVTHLESFQGMKIHCVPHTVHGIHSLWWDFKVCSHKDFKIIISSVFHHSVLRHGAILA